MKAIFLSVFILFFVSCKKESTNNKKIVVQDSVNSSKEANFKIDEIPENCYLMISGKDSSAIHLVDNLGTFTGKMAVKNSEKDSSFGDLAGFKSEDTLKLTYTFQSEGVTSESEIYFLQKNDELIEGFGDYKNPKSIKFDAKNSFKKVKCNLISNLLK